MTTELSPTDTRGWMELVGVY